MSRIGVIFLTINFPHSPVRRRIIYYILHLMLLVKPGLVLARAVVLLRNWEPTSEIQYKSLVWINRQKQESKKKKTLHIWMNWGLDLKKGYLLQTNPPTTCFCLMSSISMSIRSMLMSNLYFFSLIWVTPVSFQFSVQFFVNQMWQRLLKLPTKHILFYFQYQQICIIPIFLYIHFLSMVTYP